MKRLLFFLLSARGVWLISLSHNKMTYTVANEKGILSNIANIANALAKGTPDNTPIYLNGMDEILAAKQARDFHYSYSTLETM